MGGDIVTTSGFPHEPLLTGNREAKIVVVVLFGVGFLGMGALVISNAPAVTQEMAGIRRGRTDLPEDRCGPVDASGLESVILVT